MHESERNQPDDLEEGGIRIFQRIAEAWSLGKDEQRQMLALPELPQTADDAQWLIDDLVLMRIGYIISIYRMLHTIFRSPQQANSWIRRKNAAAMFGGEPAIKLMCTGDIEILEAVRNHLDAQMR
ncbi:antitoxin Xre/MbcA/ParS toxin-binding domain-containing protein [Stenotrophomonas sp. S41]|uniref:antitoxin Xre/MbcA/ParS toxin-binding domain-containing protein n=1 Tax=Stenotrophomonas sp. S41 TaxID=2767464 RepID=UPI00190A70EB|nr:antitoxin Xre/MbcA/ParS toxin-binding domain-containing protein [Stenotrophomonas sp. S41]MBK0010761.1 DUF2384 domain-containing protein [Stenotrophomonas sp. S41]